MVYSQMIIYLFLRRFCWYHILSYKRGILCVNLNNINLDYANFSEDDPKNIIHFWLLALHYRSKQHKASKKEVKNKINTCSLTSNKMVGSLHVRRWGNKKFFIEK